MTPRQTVFWQNARAFGVFTNAFAAYRQRAGYPRKPCESSLMRTITTTSELAVFCTAAKAEKYVTIDTEFLRERTYWSKLCLIQMALPGKDGDAVLVDPIEGSGMSLEPLYDLFRHEATVKVFHAARQDLELSLIHI